MTCHNVRNKFHLRRRFLRRYGAMQSLYCTFLMRHWSLITFFQYLFYFFPIWPASTFFDHIYSKLTHQTIEKICLIVFQLVSIHHFVHFSCTTAHFNFLIILRFVNKRFLDTNFTLISMNLFPTLRTFKIYITISNTAFTSHATLINVSVLNEYVTDNYTV